MPNINITYNDYHKQVKCRDFINLFLMFLNCQISVRFQPKHLQESYGLLDKYKQFRVINHFHSIFVKFCKFSKITT